MAPTGIAAVNRSSHSAPVSGSLPITVLASSGVVTRAIISATPTSSCVKLAATKARERNQAGRSRG